MEMLLDLSSTHGSMPLMLVNLVLSTLVKGSNDGSKYLIFLVTSNENLFQSFISFISIIKNPETIEKLINNPDFLIIVSQKILKLNLNHSHYKANVLPSIAKDVAANKQLLNIINLEILFHNEQYIFKRTFMFQKIINQTYRELKKNE